MTNYKSWLEIMPSAIRAASSRQGASGSATTTKISSVRCAYLLSN